MKRLFVAAALALLLSCSAPQPFVPVTIPVDVQHVQRGGYLFRGLAACGFCHGETADPEAVPSGGRPYYDAHGAVAAANLTPARAGIGAWQPVELLNVFRKGTGKGGKFLSTTAHRGYEWMSDEDLLSVLGYLRTLPAVEKEVSRRDVSVIDRNTTGLFEAAREVQGFVPRVSSRHELEYGKYLVDHVARCGSCHNSVDTLLTSEVYLGGSAVIRTEAGEKTAPGITGSTVFGIGSWSEEQIVHYLRTGVTPDNKRSDPAFCPTNFYRNASNEDLLAIARYLRTDTEAG